MNLTNVYNTYKDILLEGVGDALNNANKSEVTQKATNDFFKEANRLLYYKKVCFLLFVIYGQADKWAWDHEIEYDENGDEIPVEGEPEPWNGSIRTWSVEHSIFNTMFLYDKELEELLPPSENQKYFSQKTLLIDVPNKPRYFIDFFSFYYDPKYPTRYYVGGPASCPGGTACSSHIVFKDTEKAYVVPDSAGLNLAPEQKNGELSKGENLPFEHQKYFYFCILKLLINRLNNGFYLSFDVNLQDMPDPTRKDRMIKWAIENYPDKEICEWARHEFLK